MRQMVGILLALSLAFIMISVACNQGLKTSDEPAVLGATPRQTTVQTHTATASKDTTLSSYSSAIRSRIVHAPQLQTLSSVAPASSGKKEAMIIRDSDSPFPERTSSSKGFIVELDSPPLIKTPSAKAGAAAGQAKILLNTEHQSFRTSLKNSGIDKTAIIAEYSLVFNGFAIDVPSADEQKLRGLPGVKKVYPNYEVKANLMDSVPLINAVDVWNLTDPDGNPVTGKGMTIAIVDTGIDYTHGDLGGCFGAGCKVAGGYDFYNMDNDPMDDMGHGTHCAGIAAGNGVLKGVAPDATLYAYKVLGADGSGFEDDIIRGIERAVDPNNDGDFSDHVDVISLSLGGQGNPDDPGSQAVDNAVEHGVIVAVAAGNSGDMGRYTIGSPGTARKAITVAASNKSDAMAFFSSQGFVWWYDDSDELRIIVKPDVTAPGVRICSAQWEDAFEEYGAPNCVDEDHVSISGTSMATPHVAGAAALLKQMHPEWTPDEVKMALRNTAVDLNTDVLSQGYGRIDVLAAIQHAGTPALATIETGGMFRRTIDIMGTAAGSQFSHYTLYFAPGEYNEDWTELSSGTTPVENGVLFSGFDVTRLDEGINYLKLKVWNADGSVSEDRNVLYAQNIIIDKPLNNDIYRKGETISFTASLLSSLYESFEIQWGVGDEPSEWHSEGIELLNGGVIDHIIQHEEIATFDSSVVPGDDYYTLRLTIHKHDGTSATVYVKNIYVDSHLKEGWPVRIDWDTSQFDWGRLVFMAGPLASAVEDLDHDGKDEIIFLTYGCPARLKVYDQDGSKRWEKIIGECDGYNSDAVNSYNAPLVADINNDGSPEIIVINADTYVISVFSSDSSLLWTKTLPASHSHWPMVADLNNDGKNELVIKAVTQDEHGNALVVIYILDSEGNMYHQWPVGFFKISLMGGPESSPTIGNFDNDDDWEIVVSSWATSSEDNQDDGQLSVYNMDGSLVDGWPIPLPGFMFATPVVGDVDHDQKDDIIVPLSYWNRDGQDLGGAYVFDRHGQVLSGWPIGGGESIVDSASLADMDDNGYLEISLVRDPYIYLYNHDATAVHGWPYGDQLSSYYLPGLYSTTIGDVDADGVSDILKAGQEEKDRYTTGGRLDALTDQAEVISGFPHIMELTSGPHVAIYDIDGDGKVELVASTSNDFDFVTGMYKHRSTMYVWELDSNYNTKNVPWPTFLHDNYRTGHYAECGNDHREPFEQCDGTDSSFCSGGCSASCTCAAGMCNDTDNGKNYVKQGTVTIDRQSETDSCKQNFIDLTLEEGSSSELALQDNPAEVKLQRVINEEGVNPRGTLIIDHLDQVVWPKHKYMFGNVCAYIRDVYYYDTPVISGTVTMDLFGAYCDLLDMDEGDSEELQLDNGQPLARKGTLTVLDIDAQHEKATLKVTGIEQAIDEGETLTLPFGDNNLIIDASDVNTDGEVANATMTVNGETKVVKDGETVEFSAATLRIDGIFSFTAPVASAGVSFTIIDHIYPVELASGDWANIAGYHFNIPSFDDDKVQILVGQSQGTDTTVDKGEVITVELDGTPHEVELYDIETDKIPTQRVVLVLNGETKTILAHQTVSFGSISAYLKDIFVYQKPVPSKVARLFFIDTDDGGDRFYLDIGDSQHFTVNGRAHDLTIQRIRGDDEKVVTILLDNKILDIPEDEFALIQGVNVFVSDVHDNEVTLFVSQDIYLDEYYCAVDSIGKEEYTCPNYCNVGACIE